MYSVGSIKVTPPSHVIGVILVVLLHSAFQADATATQQCKEGFWLNSNGTCEVVEDALILLFVFNRSVSSATTALAIHK
jgi:hypothetical protein